MRMWVMGLPMLATGCSAPEVRPSVAPVQAEKAATAESFPEFGRTPGNDCRERGLGRFLQRKPTRALVEQARIASRSASVRVIRPRAIITQDLRRDRLNLTLDAAGVIVGARCF